MKKTKSLIVLAVSLCCGIATSNAALSLVADGGFEIPIASGSFQTFHPGAMGAWTVTPDSVDLIRSYWQPSEGYQSLDLAGNGSGGVQQLINTTAGVKYHLTFDMSGNPDNGPNTKMVLASLGAASMTFTYDYVVHGTTHGDMKWQSMSVDFTAGPGVTSLLSFKNMTDGPWGAALDNISLVAVPEPSTIIAGAMLLLPFGASTLRMMRRRSVA